MRESKIEVGQKYLLDLELHSNPIKVRVLDKSPTISGSLSEGNLSIGGIFRVQCLKTGKTYWAQADKLAPLLQNQRMKDFKSSLKSLTDAVFAADPTMGKESGGEFVIPITFQIKPKAMQKDTVVRDVRKDLKRRSKAGIEKYGTTLDREDLSLKEWLQHAYEECLDQALYLKRAIRELDKPSGDELEAKD